MKIKVCGMRDAENIRAIAQLDIDMMGFIFYRKSPRYAGLIPPASVFEDTGKKVKRVGVFVNAMPQNIVTAAYRWQLNVLQLHGAESPELCGNLRRTLDPDICPGIRVIKVISVHQPSDVDQYRRYEGTVDGFLFDTKCPEGGGSGQQFDWSVLDRYEGTEPFLLSGGIGPEDAERVKAFRHPRFAGIDVNSRFESAPGLKDVGLLRDFIQKVRN